jgi:hypothetical protein
MTIFAEQEVFLQKTITKGGYIDEFCENMTRQFLKTNESIQALSQHSDFVQFKELIWPLGMHIL